MKVLKWILWGSLAIGVVVGAREAYLALGPRRRKQRSLFQQAEARAQMTGKKLVVIGDPDDSIIHKTLGRDYQCGDLCIDAHGCPQCPVFVAGGIAATLPHLNDNSAVVFIAPGILERVEGDMSALLLALDRVSGGDLFIAHVEPTSLIAWAPLAGRRRILHAPPDTEYFDYKPLPWHPEPVPASRYRVALPNASTRAANTIPAHGSVVDERVIDIPVVE